MKKFAHLLALALLTTAVLSLTVSLASSDQADLCYNAPTTQISTADTAVQEGDFDPSRYEIVNPQDVPCEPAPAPCECGGETILYQICESGYIKGIYSPCVHGLNGNAATNTIVYVVQCQSCGQGESFSRRVVLTQCNH